MAKSKKKKSAFWTEKALPSGLYRIRLLQPWGDRAAGDVVEVWHGRADEFLKNGGAELAEIT